MDTAFYMNPEHLALIILAINLVAFASMWLDKQLAKGRHWRIPEASLFALAMAGGAPGIWLGMRRFRHKSAKGSFQLRLVLIVVVQLAVAGYFLTRP